MRVEARATFEPDLDLRSSTLVAASREAGATRSSLSIVSRKKEIDPPDKKADKVLLRVATRSLAAVTMSIRFFFLDDLLPRATLIDLFSNNKIDCVFFFSYLFFADQIFRIADLISNTTASAITCHSTINQIKFAINRIKYEESSDSVFSRVTYKIFW